MSNPIPRTGSAPKQQVDHATEIAMALVGIDNKKTQLVYETANAINAINMARTERGVALLASGTADMINAFLSTEAEETQAKIDELWAECDKKNNILETERLTITHQNKV